VPFSFYDTFLMHNGLCVAASTMIASPQFHTDIAVRENARKEFRKLIKKATVPPEPLSKLTALEKKFPPRAAIRPTTKR
jgi:hypothetical protein